MASATPDCAASSETFTAPPSNSLDPLLDSDAIQWWPSIGKEDTPCARVEPSLVTPPEISERSEQAE